ncbi:MAG: hypothetical protein AABY22_33180, partial [Nanoarchaeota archaeon]
MANIQKSNTIPEKVKKLLEASGIDVSVGDIFVENNHNIRIIRIKSLKIEKYHDGDRLFAQTEIASDWEATEWRNWGSSSIDEFKEEGKYTKLTKPVSEYMEEALKVINGEIDIKDLSIQETETDSNNTSLISRSSKEGLIAIQKDMELKKSRVELIKSFVSYEMEKRKQELDRIRQKLEGVLVVFKKQMKRIIRVITTIELYLGIDEEIVQ